MRLTVYADYALRVLMYVGLKEPGLATVSEISESYDISRNHLMKVVHQLGILGYLENIRGKGGGIHLAQPPSHINIGAVIRQVENDMALVQCFDIRTSRCRIEPACVLRPILGEALAAFFSVVDGYTLEDLIAPRRRLRRLLHQGRGTIGASPEAGL
jgi:Rrf2 family transcriptional regulator, nitric oxide-sensitive transcriptional repressor